MNSLAQVAPATVSIPSGRSPDDPASETGPLLLSGEMKMLDKPTGNEAIADMVVDETQTAANRMEEALTTRMETVMGSDPSKSRTAIGVGMSNAPDNNPQSSQPISYAGLLTGGRNPAKLSAAQ
ncbi:unnamed protein product [Linum trigynum]|uniref:Uncharacterized protein n=1 Tax=Linum trigynum TaxID=586398 RepID=A0AAV2E5L1_9ROSI